jgi:hypothetical protein
MSIQEEITSASSISDVVHGHPMYINIAVHYVRPNQITYARDTLQAVIRDVVDSDDLDLEADPSLARVFYEVQSQSHSSKFIDPSWQDKYGRNEIRNSQLQTKGYPILPGTKRS